MAESILFDAAGSLVMKLGSLALQELTLLWGVKDELEKLKDTVFSIKAILHDAEEQQFKSHAVKNWVSRLTDALYDIDDLIDEFSYETLRRQVLSKDRRKTKEVRIFFSKSNQIAFGLKMGHKIKKVREKLNAIDVDKTQFNFSERMIIDTRDDGLRKGRESYSFIPEGEVIGRDGDKKAIIDFLLDTNVKEVAVIAIVGMGGLGKTALAQSVYNDTMITEHFELKLWVCISEEFDVKIIVEKIIKSVTRKKPKLLEMDLLQSELRSKIDGKKYLLVMDDVWNENHEKWVSLRRLLIGGANGSRILITTRSKRVAETSDVLSLYSLENLNEDDSWLLFKEMAFFKGAKEELENSNFDEIGKEIVAKLKGVPLAIRTIGRILYFKKSEVDWLSFKDNELNKVMQQENEMQLILKLSYSHLPSNLKQCFTYCALFPKDYEIQKEKVTKLWEAQGFIEPHDTMAFNDLLWRSFFQDVRRNEWGDIIACKMHDFMHDLACSIVETECMLGDVNARLINKRTRHISLHSSLCEKLDLPESLFEAKNLRTFFLVHHLNFFSHGDHNEPLLNKILSNFFRLRTLDLRLSSITKVPKFISKLKHLRYLDLSRNYGIEFLPHSITELYNLETLILSSCIRLKELPRDINNCINLKHLDISVNANIELLPNSITELHNLEALIICDCIELRELPSDAENWTKLRHLDMHGCHNLTHMPKGLGGLTRLQTMNLFVIGKDDGSGLSELNGLNRLKGSLTIRGLEFWTVADLQNNARYLKLKSGIRKLELQWDSYENKPNSDALDDHERVLECLQPHSNVQKICVWGYQGMRLCNWLSFNSLVHLVSIKLSTCERLQHLPPFHQFPFLKRLHLENLTCIEYIDSNDYLSSPTLFFPFLEKLSIVGMPNLKGWWKGETSSESTQNSVVFPTMLSCISQLKIVNCHQLASIPQPQQAPLKSLEIGGVSLQLYNMVMKSSSTQSKLSSLHLGEIEGLEFLPEELFWNNLANLKSLTIENCKNLRISSSHVEQRHPVDEDDDAVWKELGSLLNLDLRNIPNMEYLPEGLQHVTTLEELKISDCPNLMILPEWIGKLSLLSELAIDNCPKLTSLPEEICHLTSLLYLRICNCPNLTSLSEGIEHLTSLSVLDIMNCPNLPEGMCHLHSLRLLILDECPNWQK